MPPASNVEATSAPENLKPDFASNSRPQNIVGDVLQESSSHVQTIHDSHTPDVASLDNSTPVDDALRGVVGSLVGRLLKDCGVRQIVVVLVFSIVSYYLCAYWVYIDEVVV